MQEIFGDTSYWVALLDKKDSHHDQAIGLTARLSRDARIITSDLVMVELCNFFGERGALARHRAIDLYSKLRLDTRQHPIGLTTDLIDKTTELYLRFSDKGWSFTDCASFIIMQDRNISDALSHDHHFNQAGFRALMRDGAG